MDGHLAFYLEREVGSDAEVEELADSSHGD